MIHDDTNPLSSTTRIIAFVVGLVVAAYMFIYSFNYDQFPHTFTVLGFYFTEWVVIMGLVLITALASWFIKMGITGRTKF